MHGSRYDAVAAASDPRPAPSDRRRPLARAKRTDRTEARRRRRDGQPAVASAQGTAAATAVAPSGGAGPKPAAPTHARPGIVTAVRTSFRPLDIQGDLRALPRLLVHWSFWGPALATLATTAVLLGGSAGWPP